MNKETWIKHIEVVSSLQRPSLGGDVVTWKGFLSVHCRNCNLCQARQKTRQVNRNQKAIRDVYKDCGLKRVIGNLGGIYYE